MMKNHRAACDHGGHSGHSTEEKIKRNFPCPHRRFDHGLAIISWLARNWAARNIDTAIGNDSFLPRFLAQLFESLFGSRIGRHEKNAKVRRMAMNDAIAVANAAVHADFR